MGAPMKDLNTLKKELTRLADVDMLKKELSRLAGEIKDFDVHVALSPQAKSRLTKLEKRFRELMKRLARLQKEVDRSLAKFVKLVRRSTGTAAAKKSRRTTKKKTSRRASTTRKA
jgi:Skp family chaperone for outer membrane proteins